MVWPVVALGVGASIVSVALVGTIAATEKSSEPVRRDYIGLARAVLKHRMRRAQGSGNELLIEELTSVLKDIRLLEQNIRTGWHTQPEAAAIARVTVHTSIGLATNAADDLIEGMFVFGDEMNVAFNDLAADLKKAFGWIYAPPNAMAA